VGVTVRRPTQAGTALASAPAARRGARAARLLGLGLLLLGAGGCRGCPSQRPPIHLNPNMDRQPKLIAQAESGFFADGAAMRAPLEGTVARGELALPEAVRTGRTGDGFVAAIPVSVDERVLARGAERYEIYCGLCHGERGDGRGMLWERAQIASANLHDERIRALAPGQVFDVVSHGSGLMGRYDYAIPIADRWAIVAWVRQLQEVEGTGEAAP
jgi:mono/diheme cytochrome c family protein